MVLPGMSFKETALQLISQGKKPKDVSEMVAKLKEQFSSDEKYAASLDERQLMESAITISAIEKEMEEAIRRDTVRHCDRKCDGAVWTGIPGVFHNLMGQEALVLYPKAY